MDGARDDRRPLIGITGPDHGGATAWWFTRLMVRRGGGRAVRIRPSQRRTLDDLDGLVIGGGADVGDLPELLAGEAEDDLEPPAEPAQRRWWRVAAAQLLRAARVIVDVTIGLLVWIVTRSARLLGAVRTRIRGPQLPQAPGPRPLMLDPDRDDLERALLRQADARGLPVLGICRGAQLMNVHRGGTLHRDLRAFYGGRRVRRTPLPTMEVTLERDTRLARALGGPSARVNRMHSHAVAELGDRLRVAARNRAGIIQAVEDCADHWWVGVQWHPEYLPQKASQRRLFAALVTAARQRDSTARAVGQ